MSNPYVAEWTNGIVDLYYGDARDLSMIADSSVHCVVTSPPYWGLRNYGIDNGIGLEPTFIGYMDNIVAVGHELWRVLRDDGTFWLNLGDSYSGAGYSRQDNTGGISRSQGGKQKHTPQHIPAKNLIGLPWRAAFALQDDGWILRSAITWVKPNPMPESVRDRPTSASEMIFMFAKQGQYFYDADAIRSPYSAATIQRVSQPSFDQQQGGPKDYGANRSARRGVENLKARVDKQRGHWRRHEGFNDRWDAMSKEEQQAGGANARNVWTIATQPRADAHFATFPDELPRRCILAGAPEGGTVLDPFIGSGTTAAVAQALGRRAIGVDLSQDYLQIAQKRIEAVNLPLPL